MNLKSKAISLAIIVLLCVSVPVHSQGLFKSDATTTQENTTANNRGGLLRGPDPPPIEPPGDLNTPIGEGLAILSLLSGGFFMLKRRDSKK